MVPFEVCLSARLHAPQLAIFKRFREVRHMTTCCAWNGCEQLFTLRPIHSPPPPWDVISIRAAKCKSGVKASPKVILWQRNDRTRGDVGPNISPDVALHQTSSFCTSLWQSSHTNPFISISLRLKQKLWYFKDYLYFSRAVEPPPFPFDMTPISTNLHT